MKKINNIKITEFFENTNNNPISKIGTPPQKTTHQSEPLTTKKYKNNTNQISKDINNNINSKHVATSKTFKRMENLYSEEEMFNFDENSRESGTVSEESKNNIIEDNVSLTTSSTTYRGKNKYNRKKQESKIPNSKQKQFRI